MGWLNPVPGDAASASWPILVGVVASVVFHGLALSAVALAGRTVPPRREVPPAVEVILSCGAPRRSPP